MADENRPAPADLAADHDQPAPGRQAASVHHQDLGSCLGREMAEAIDNTLPSANRIGSSDERQGTKSKPLARCQAAQRHAGGRSDQLLAHIAVEQRDCMVRRTGGEDHAAKGTLACVGRSDHKHPAYLAAGDMGGGTAPISRDLQTVVGLRLSVWATGPLGGAHRTPLPISPRFRRPKPTGLRPVSHGNGSGGEGLRRPKAAFPPLGPSTCPVGERSRRGLLARGSLKGGAG
jgi:hypothetical protein